jgi:hypothetical protein
MAWLRGFALFALLVAVPLFLEQLFGRHPMARHIKVSSPFWENVLSYSGFILLVFLLAGFLIVLMAYLPQTIRISEWLTVAERDLNSLLRGWGGGLQKDTRREWVKERADWLTMIPVPKDKPEAVAGVYKDFFDKNQSDLEKGGSQATPGKQARFTAFLLREIYEGNVKNAQLKIFNEVKSGNKEPYIAPGVRQIVGYDDRFNPDIKPDDPEYKNYKYGFPKGAGEGWFPVLLTVKLNRFPRHIIMVKPDKTVVENWDVIDELNRQLRPKPA